MTNDFQHQIMRGPQKSFFILSIAIFFLLITCSISYYLGADTNWDLLNYHFYNGYTYTHGKFITDSIATAQSYLDPLLNSFYYELISNLSPLNANLLIAAIQSLSLSATFFLSYNIFNRSKYKIIISLVVSVAAIFGPVFWSEIGGTMGDTLLSSPIILALIFLIKAISVSETTKRRFFYASLAGFLVGFASGLKFTNMTYAVGMATSLALVLWISGAKYRDQFYILFAFILSATISFILVYAPVGYLLWMNFHNPIFPYFNNIFKSGYMGHIAFRDERWFPTSLIGYFELPFLFCFRHHQHNTNHLIGLEIPFRTFFYAVILALTPVYMASRYFNHKSTDEVINKGFFIVVFFVTSFVVWELMFSYLRYISVLEIIAPLTFIIIIFSFINNKLSSGIAVTIITIAALGLSLLSLPDNTWGREPYSKSYFGVTKSELKKYNHALLIVGHAPMGFILPYFPGNDKIIGLPERISALTSLFQKAYLGKFYNFHGNIYFLDKYDNGQYIPKSRASYLLKKYDLIIDYGSCKKINTNFYAISICLTRRTKE